MSDLENIQYVQNPNPASASSHIELNPEFFKKNIEFIREKMDEGVTLSAVIKGNAYGHGINQFVPMAEELGIDHFSVYGMEEARTFHAISDKKSHLMIMGYISNDNLGWVIKNKYSFFIYDLFELHEAIEAAKKVGMPARVHIELETGMNRTGIEEIHFNEVMEVLRNQAAHLHLSGVCSHLAGSESISNYYRVKHQIIRFKQYIKRFDAAGIVFEKKHISCSATLIRYPKNQFDMVRIGILMYGFWPNRETMIDYMTKNKIVDDPLKPFLSWKTKVMSLKYVEAGEYIGYGTSYLTNRKTVVAVVPVGYAYGYSRVLSNLGLALVHGQRVSVLGTVNMNMLALDVTEAGNIQHDDEVVLIGEQGDNKISVSAFGEMSSQLNYELLARLPHNIPRILK